MKSMNLKKLGFVLGVSFAALNAQADDKISLNGYGFQDLSSASANVLNGADTRGTVSNNFFALVMSAKISDRDTAWAQLETGTGPTRFTWVFVGHRFSDDVTAKVGRVKFPYGLYNEFIDNKWLQVAATIPTAYSGAADMVYDAYNGVGFDWTLGDVFAQVFGGNIYVPPNGGVAATPFSGTNPPTVAAINDRNVIGTRLTWNTPLDGLRFMVSANETQIELASAALGQIGKEDRAMFSVDYVNGSLDIKSEYNYHLIPDMPGFHSVASNAWYVQTAYKLAEFTPYVRYDGFVADSRFSADPSYFQNEWTVGVNYKINSNVNVRAEDHIINGYGLPVASGETALNKGTTNWNMATASVNFIF